MLGKATTTDIYGAKALQSCIYNSATTPLQGKRVKGSTNHSSALSGWKVAGSINHSSALSGGEGAEGGQGE